MIDIEAIQRFLEQNPNVSMTAAARHFNIPYRRFRTIVQTELTLWKVKKPEKKDRDPKIFYDLDLAYKQNSKTVRAAYETYCQIENHIPLTERVFRTLCAEKGYVFQFQSKKVYQIKKIEDIFQLHSTEVNTRTFRRSFLNLLLSQPDEKLLLKLDSSLTPEHRDRYSKIKDSKCWTCGKSKHVNLPVRLEIDHISGEPRDNRLSNLRLICACCHKYTINHSQNKPKKTRLLHVPLSVAPLYSNFEPEVDIESMKQLFLEQD